MKRGRGVVAAAMLFAAQAAALEHDSQVWLLSATQGRVGSIARWYFETQPRVSLVGPRSVRLLVRPAVGAQLTPELSVWAGYAWVPQLMPAFVEEHRAYEQLLLEHRWGRWSMLNRTRFEQRFIDVSGGGAGGVSLRLRHMLRAVWKLGDRSPFALAAYDEPFFGLNDLGRGPVAGFDQNRAFVGVNYKLDSLFQVELGYLNVVSRRRGLDTLMSHNVLLFLLADFPDAMRAES